MVLLMTIPVELRTNYKNTHNIIMSKTHTEAFVADVGDCIFPLRSL